MTFIPSSNLQKKKPDYKMDKAWELIQTKTFTKWVNNKLVTESIPPVQSLFDELADGVRLIQLLQIVGGTTIRPFNKRPVSIFQKTENLNAALDFIKSRGVPLTNIGANDIEQKNKKLVLGMLWLIILRLTMVDISEDGNKAKESLLLWCQRKTANYEDVDIRNFSNSWTDGLAFCALIHCHRPDLLDYHSLNKLDRHGNTALAFEAAKKLGIPQLLDVEDVCDISEPDEISVMTYVAEYFHRFSADDEYGTAGRRVAKFADVLATVWDMTHNYEQRVFNLMEVIEIVQEEWETTELTDSYLEAKQKSISFNNYKNTTKREWLAEKRGIESYLGNIQTKAKTYNVKPYFPPPGLTLKDLDNAWLRLLDNEAKYHLKINRTIRAIKEGLRVAFADAANRFQSQLDMISAELVDLKGDLDTQLTFVESLTESFLPLQEELDMIQLLDQACQEANTEENDYTVYSVDDLSFGLDLVKEAVYTKCQFIENQKISREMTNLTPAQLEEFEQTFYHFDEHRRNTLTFTEFRYAISSFGIVYPKEELESMFYEMTRGAEVMNFQQFIYFTVSVTEDKTTPGELLDSFRKIADGNPFVTEVQLRKSHVEMKLVDYLKKAMPKVTDDGYDYESFIQNMFN